MKKKNFKGIAVAFLAFLMMAQTTSSLAAIQPRNNQLLIASNTQMSSYPEIMYVNTYSDSTIREQNFDANWKFYLGDTTGAEGVAFDDSKWESISLPHDYSIEQEYSESMEAESGYLPGGTGWYRKHFVISEELRGKKLRIDFGGVYMNATIWVNGQQLGTHPYGYTPFSFDITDYVQFGRENVITVKVDHQTPSSRWYSGSGIYRSVNLTVTDPVHVNLYGTKIETPNLETEKGGTVNMNIKTTVANESAEAKDVVLTHTIYKKGTTHSIGTVTTEAQSVAAGQAADINAVLPASNPALWDTKNPNLYTVTTEVKVANNVVDTYNTEYGFRYITLDTNTGFYLNGENLKLKGVCMHHDQGSLGSEAYYRAIERQVEILQEMGCNAIRVTHNPASNELIEICNEKGILIVEELFDGWMHAKNGNINDYSKWFTRHVEEGNQILGAEDSMTWAQFDLTATIKRGQNSPAIIMFSLGNEIQEGAGGSGYATMADSLIEWARAIDTTKPLTIGSNVVKNGSEEHISIANKLTAVGGMSGTNYSDGASYDNLHSTYPDWYLYGSETVSSVNSRGVYRRIAEYGQTSEQELTSYDASAVPWGTAASSAWYNVITRDFVAGEFVWTGFDYIGEPTFWNGMAPGAQGTWPSPKNSFFGIVDTAGLPKDSYYLYQSQWNDDVNTLHILPAWNDNVVYKDASGNVPVVVYSDAASVELFFKAAGSDTATSLGRKTFTEHTTAAGYKYQIYEGDDKDSTVHKNLYLTWQVPYADGEVYAVAYDKEGNEISNTKGRSSVKTTGTKTALNAVVDHNTITADGKDLAYIRVDVTDAEGNIVPDADNRVTFNVEGDGVLLGVDNGKQTDHESYQADNRRAYKGSLIAIVQSTKNAGTIKVTATANGLTSDSVTITTTKDNSEETQNQVESFLMPKNYYVKVGTIPKLPNEVEANYTNGAKELLPVVWNKIEASDVAQVGSFVVQGTVNGQYTVSVIVNVIDEVAGLLNYSTTVLKGQVPILPEARPAANKDGSILTALFPVEWSTVPDTAYDNTGIVTVKGTSNVFGTKYPVTATIRVQEETFTIGESISEAATLSQNIEGSDTLDAIKDGSTTIGDNLAGGANPYAWSNWQASQDGNKQAEITFEYDTQQRIGQVVVYYAEDQNSMRYPDAGSTEIYISETGADGTWTKVDATETIGAEGTRVTPYTYDFDPVTATFVKVCVTNTEEETGTGQKACTAITEVELKKVQGNFVENTSAELASLTVNDVSLTEAELASGIYYTLDEVADITAIGKDNAAVTVLPEYNGEIRIFVEAEDHSTLNTFIVKLGQEAPLPPDDPSRDIPVSVLTATTGSEEPLSGSNTTQGSPNLALDDDPNTLWHSLWAGDDRENLWIQFELSEDYQVDGLRYLPRSDAGSEYANGTITSYKIQVSNNGTDWEDVALGNDWENDNTWKSVKFDPVNARYVRFSALESTSNDTRQFASAAEIRLTGAKKCDHTNTEVQNTREATCTETGYTGDTVCLDCGAKVEKGTQIAALGHSYGEWRQTTAPTCTEAGVEIRTCGNDATHEETREVAALGHSLGELTNVKDATCTEVGYTGDRICTVCNETVEQGTEIPATGHEYGEWTQTTAPTCTEKGVETRTCNHDSTHTETREVDALGHSLGELTNVKDATCTEAGYTGDRICTRCNETIEQGTEIPATGHEYGEWTQTTAPTCTEKGVETRVCNHDSTHTETREVEALGHSLGELTNVKDATCTEAGYTGDKICTRCNETVEPGTEIPAIGHEYGEWTQTTAPTCTEKGVETRTCNHDSAHTETREVEALGHSLGELTNVKDATCTEAGYTGDKICTRCNETVEPGTEIPAIGHEYGEWTQTTAPTCTEKGVETRTCNHDSAHTETREVAVLGHSLGELANVKDATCTEAGYTGDKICTRCNETVEPGTEIPAIGHEYGDWTQTTAPTCTEKGVETRTCNHDSTHTETREVEALGHSLEELTNVKDATCTEAGYTGDKICTRCNETVEPGTEIPAIGHEYGDWTQTTAPTCTEAGVETRTCNHDATHTETREVEALGHSLGELTNAKEATCTEAGYTGDRICTRCNETVELGTEIPALGHEYGEWTQTTAPTCTEKGVETRVCNHDSTHTETREVAALGHSLGELTNAKDATCTEAGYTGDRICTRCNETVEPGTVIPALGHEFEELTHMKDPTCTEVGYTGDTVCKTCGETIEQGTEIPALGHEFGEWTQTTAPTCTEAGVETRTCNHDATHTETREVEALGHSLGELTNVKDATCTEEGYTGDKICTTCNETVEQGTVIPAIGHEFGEWTQTTAPTCTEAGVETRVCNHDSTHTETREVAVLGHSYGEWVVVKEATKTEEGLKEKICSVCGDKVTEVIPILPATTVDKEEAQKYYDDCLSKYVKPKYGATASWTKYVNAMDDLKSVLIDETTTVEEVAEAVAKVEEMVIAIENELAEPSTIPETPTEPVDTDVDTSDINVGTYVVTLLIAIAGIVLASMSAVKTKKE